MTTNQRVLLVVNPISGGRDKSNLIEQIKVKLLESRADLHIYNTTGVRDREQLTEITSNYQPTRILVAGGDGTIKLIAEILEDDTIPLGILPVGSANGLAENLDLPTDSTEIIEVALGNNFIKLDTIEINSELCLHMSDVGLNAALIKNYQEGNIRGKLGYIIQSIPTLIESEFPFHFKIEKDGITLHRNAVLLAIANARKYGTGATINPNGRYDDDLFEVLIFKEFNIPEILKTFRDNVELSRDFVEIFSTSEVKIECTKNVPFQIDGEYRGEVKEVNAVISPIKIKIAVPPKKDHS